MKLEEIKKLRDLEFTIENTPKGDRIYIIANKEFAELFRKALNELEESGEKSMLYNVTVKHEENKVLAKCWEMEAAKLNYNTCAFPSMPVRCVRDRKYIDHEPTPEEIAQFLSDNKADFVSVVQNYRFEK